MKAQPKINNSDTVSNPVITKILLAIKFDKSSFYDICKLQVDLLRLKYLLKRK